MVVTGEFSVDRKSRLVLPCRVSKYLPIVCTILGYIHRHRHRHTDRHIMGAGRLDCCALLRGVGIQCSHVLLRAHASLSRHRDMHCSTAHVLECSAVRCRTYFMRHPSIPPTYIRAQASLGIDIQEASVWSGRRSYQRPHVQKYIVPQPHDGS